MKRTLYTGTFISDMRHSYQLQVYASGFIQAFILLTADAIRSGNHYELDKIESEDGSIRWVGDIIKIGELLYD